MNNSSSSISLSNYLNNRETPGVPEGNEAFLCSEKREDDSMASNRPIRRDEFLEIIDECSKIAANKAAKKAEKKIRKEEERRKKAEMKAAKKEKRKSIFSRILNTIEKVVPCVCKAIAAVFNFLASKKVRQ